MSLNVFFVLHCISPQIYTHVEILLEGRVGIVKLLSWKNVILYCPNVKESICSWYLGASVN